jgi:hypothetical protein
MEGVLVLTYCLSRACRFAILGMSLSNLLDFNQPQDLLRGLMNTITEYDQSKDDNDKSKMVCPPLLDPNTLEISL